MQCYWPGEKAIAQATFRGGVNDVISPAAGMTTAWGDSSSILRGNVQFSWLLEDSSHSSSPTVSQLENTYVYAKSSIIPYVGTISIGLYGKGTPTAIRGISFPFQPSRQAPLPRPKSISPCSRVFLTRQPNATLVSYRFLLLRKKNTQLDPYRMSLQRTFVWVLVRKETVCVNGEQEEVQILLRVAVV